MPDQLDDIDARRTRALFELASGLPADRRREALTDACAPGDAHLLADVLELLDIDARAHPFLDTPLIDRAAPAPEAALPDVVGAYHIVRHLGSGAMGTVYEGRHVDTRQPVAIKMMRRGLLSDVGLRRFQQEGEILQRLHHPFIARIFEAGTSSRDPHARPYLVMALVDGVPIDRHCTETELSATDILALLVRVCEGVGHAHRHDVIHRDLKPGNVLVDATGAPRILDFGIARAVADTDGTHPKTYTATGQLVGTLPYMSPEQASGAPSRELDVRSDVYALGVLAYRLLAKRHPYDLDDLSLADALRVIAQHDPPLLGSVNRAYRGPIETIVARALEKAPSERYSSADEFADDIRRTLKQQPITARLPSALDVLRRFGLRNPALARALGLTLVVLLLGVIGTSWGLIEASRENARAEGLLTLERDARQSADDARTEAEEAVEFLTKILGMTPEGLGRNPTVRDALHEAAESLNASPPTDARLAARLHVLVGRAFLVHDIFGEAEGHYAQGIALLTSTLGAEHPSTLAARAERLIIFQMSGDFARAQSELDALHAHGLDAHSVTSDLGTLRLATSYRLAGRLDDSQRVIEELRARRDTFEPAFRDALDSHYGDLLMALDRHAEAEPLVRATLDDARTRFGMENPITFAHVSKYANVLAAIGRTDESTALALEATRGLTIHAGPDDIRTLRAIRDHIRAIAGASVPADAILLLEDSIKRLRRVVGSHHIETAYSLAALGNLKFGLMDGTGLDATTESLATLRALGAADSPVPQLLRSALFSMFDDHAIVDDLHARTFAASESPRDIALVFNRVGDMEVMRNNELAALEAFQMAYALSRVAAPNDEETSKNGADLAGQLIASGRLREAVAVLDCVEDADELSAAITLRTAQQRASIAIAQRDWTEAEVQLRRADAAAREDRGPTHFATQSTTRALAVFLLERNRPADAQPIMLDMLQRSRATRGDDDAETILDLGLLAACLAAQGHSDQAEALHDEAVRLGRALEVSREGDFRMYDVPALISAYWKAGQPRPAHDETPPRTGR